MPYPTKKNQILRKLHVISNYLSHGFKTGGKEDTLNLYINQLADYFLKLKN